MGVFWDPNFRFANNFFAPGQGVIPNLFFLPVNNNNNGSNGGVVGGGQIGYNYQFNPSIVVGVETDFQGTSLSGNNNNNNFLFFPSPFNTQFVPGRGFVNPSILVPVASGNNWNNHGVSYFGTVRGRLGWLFTPSLLVYGTGGFAYGGSSGFFDNINPGWTAGGGLEWMFAPNWSAKVEYLFVELSGNRNNNNSGWGFGWNGGWNNRQPLNVVRVGVNYHFNWAQPVPVLAKY